MATDRSVSVGGDMFTRLTSTALVLCAVLVNTGCGGGSGNGSDSGQPGGARAQPAPVDAAWLVDVTEQWGIDFTSRTGARGELHMREIMAGGVALFDFDNDGDLDIYFINGQDDPERPGTGHNRLYRQDSPGRFVDVKEQSGLGDPHYGMGCAIGDINNDGNLDVFVTNDGPDQLYLNNGDGTFTNITSAAGIDNSRWSVSAAFVDYNRDGFLDLFIAQYVAYDPSQKCADQAGRPDYCGPKSFPPLSDTLLRNNGDGTFTDVSAEAGITAIAAAGLGVVCADFSGDDWPDIYVANDAYDNHMWINQGDGTFRNDALLLGVALNMHGQDEAGMGVIAEDLDNDLDLDLMLTHLADETNTLYRNRGTGFEDATGAAGMAAASFASTGFGITAFDIELDGDLDIAIANGRVTRADPRDDSCAPLPWSRYAEPNLFFINDGRGVFTSAPERAPAFTGPVEISRGLAMGDLDNDGDIDIVVNNLECKARIYRNDAPRRGSWLRVRTTDPDLNRDAIGASVTVAAGEDRWLRIVSAASSYASSNDSRVHFGLGERAAYDWIEVRWPDGSIERFAGGSADESIVVSKGTGTEVAGTP